MYVISDKLLNMYGYFHKRVIPGIVPPSSDSTAFCTSVYKRSNF